MGKIKSVRPFEHPFKIFRLFRDLFHGTLKIGKRILGFHKWYVKLFLTFLFFWNWVQHYLILSWPEDCVAFNTALNNAHLIVFSFPLLCEFKLYKTKQ